MEERADKTADWHSLEHADVLERLGVGADGLTATDVEDRLERYGHNSLTEEKSPGPLALAARQLMNPLIIMLLIAAAISLIAGHPVDAIVIMAVVVLNSVIGVIQESRAEKALEALRQLSAPHARVLRDAAIEEIQAADVVPGDVVVLETGDRVPADLRLLESVELTLDESALTGESEPVRKSVGALDAGTPLADRTSMAWTSTAVTGGRGKGVVVATGMETVIGRIASDVQGTRREDTPLQRRLARLSVILGVASITAAVAIFAFGLLRGFDVVEMLLFAVAAAVSAIPEGLPAVVSVVLAMGVQRMSHRSAIIRRLPAVETLGSTTVICSDKTGTITRNQMTVRRIWTAGGSYEVSGDGFRPEGAVRDEDGADISDDVPHILETLAITGVVSNNAELVEGDGQWSVRGNPTDGAMLVSAGKLNLDVSSGSALRTRVDELPFSSEAKYAATLSDAGGERRLYVKGAPERLLSSATAVLTPDGPVALDDDARQRIQEANHLMADQALRVVAGAYRETPSGRDAIDRRDAESELVFVGMWGMFDPPRDAAISAVAAAQGAGIRVVMITGDHAATAAAIARQVGITAHGESTVTGAELDALSDEELSSHVEEIGVYARVAPEHKYRIVEALKSRGHVVAMTGDGVNDAPALKVSDIGIAMGVTGTEVAKEAADMVLGDDDFATIVTAVEEGRVIYSNLRRVVAFLLSTTTAEVLTLFAALALGFHLPLTAVMILWINLVADGISTIPLGLEPKHSDVLNVPPRPTGEGILPPRTVIRLLVLAAVAATVTMVLFARASAGGDTAYSQTVAFTTLAAFEWFKAMTWRTSSQSVFAVGLLSNRWLVIALAVGVALQVAAVQSPLGRLAFGTTPLGWEEWALILVSASSVLILDEIGKALIGRRGRDEA